MESFSDCHSLYSSNQTLSGITNTCHHLPDPWMTVPPQKLWYYCLIERSQFPLDFFNSLSFLIWLTRCFFLSRASHFCRTLVYRRIVAWASWTYSIGRIDKEYGMLTQLVMLTHSLHTQSADATHRAVLATLDFDTEHFLTEHFQARLSAADQIPVPLVFLSVPDEPLRVIHEESL